MKYEIICHDKARFEITELQKEAVYKLSGSETKGVDINGEFIFFSNIARIEKIKEKQYKALTTIDQTLKGFPKERKIKALNSIVKGIKKYIASPKNQGTGKPERILKHMERKIKLVYDN